MTDPDNNPIGFLQELCQKHALRFPIYKDISASGPDHSKLFKVKCEFEEQEALGTSRQKKQAKSEAARAMIVMLKCKDFFSSLNKGSELRDRPSSCVQANFGAALNFESKNPISLIYEYCQKNAMPPAEFVETFVGGVFFCQCRLNDKNTYGNGINKKAAKTDAASKMCLELNMNCAGANYVLKELENEKNDAVSEKNPISALQEYCSQYCSTESPVYTELPPVMNLFVVQCKLGLKSSEGMGTSKKIAKAEAASKVLSDLLANGGKLENANGNVEAVSSLSTVLASASSKNKIPSGFKIEGKLKDFLADSSEEEEETQKNNVEKINENNEDKAPNGLDDNLSGKLEAVSLEPESALKDISDRITDVSNPAQEEPGVSSVPS